MVMRMIGFLWLPSFVKSTRISDEEWHVTPLKPLESSRHRASERLCHPCEKQENGSVMRYEMWRLHAGRHMVHIWSVLLVRPVV